MVNPAELRPQAMEVPLREQNVTFIDNEPGEEHDYGSTMDSLRLEPMATDASLEEFFSRPLRIGSVDWAVGNDLNVSYWPWEAYFSNKRVVNRISNYKLLSCELCVKVVVNGNSFTYGKAIVSYTPFVGYDDLSRFRSIAADICALSQRPHVYIDPCTSQGGCLSLPFSWWENTLDVTSDTYLDVGTTDFTKMGQLDLKSLNGLKHANGATDTINVNIYVWAKNVKLAVPTIVGPSNMVPQAEEFVINPREHRFPRLPTQHRAPKRTLAQAYEYVVDPKTLKPQAKDEYTGSGIISKPATAIANYLSRVKAPVIQPYITATQLAASTVGAIASLFGYSRPVHLSSSRYQPNTKHNMAVSNLEDDVTKLALDSKQELTIDPSAYGLSTKDEMDINFIAGRESYWNTFTWALGKGQQELLWNAIVDPMVPIKYDGGGETEIHCPAITFAAMPFNRWRGSIKYRFQIVASKFHRGRLRIVYDPSACGGTGDQARTELNTAYTTIVDISNTTDFTVVAGWGQSTTYRAMGPLSNPQSLYMDTDRLDYDSNGDEFGNGVIAVYVETELTVPNTDINNDIEINVFISAGDDFELAMPTGERVTRLRLRQPSELTPQAKEFDIKDSKMYARFNADTGEYEDDFSKFRPQGMETEPSSMAENSIDTPEKPTTIATLGETIPTSDPANLMHFGESIRSFRQLVKRYNQHERVSLWKNTTLENQKNYTFKMQRPSLPFEPGYAPTGVLSQPYKTPFAIGTSPNARPYAYAVMTLLRYVTLGYVGWRGSIRYLLDTGNISCTCSATGPLSVTRYSDCSPENYADENFDTKTTQGQAEFMANYDDVSGQEGFIVQNLSLNPTATFEVPFYSEKRFAPCRKLTNFNANGLNYGPCWKMRLPLRATADTTKQALLEQAAVNTFVAAGEDFSLGFFIGAPVFYLEAIPPT